MATAEEFLTEVVPETEVEVEEVGEAFNFFCEMAAATASALATAAATDVGTCFVLLRFRLPETVGR